MSLWKQNKIKKQQKKKRTKKVLKAREEILSLLSADKLKKAREIASIVLKKHPGDIRAWRLVAGVKAWEKFDERIRGFPSGRKEVLKSSALKVMKRELTSRDNLRAEVLAETLISLVPAGEVAAESAEPVVAEEVPAIVEAPEAVPAEKAPAKKSPSSKKPKAAEAPAYEKADGARKPATKGKKAEPKKSTPAKKAETTEKTETSEKSTKKETAKKPPAKRKTK